MSEIYNLGTPHYYAVAVAHQRDNSSELVSEGIESRDTYEINMLG